MLSCIERAALRLLWAGVWLGSVAAAGAAPGFPSPGAGASPEVATETQEPLTEEQCREIARRLGDPDQRKEAREELAKAASFPAKLWVDLLNDGDLVTRLGALEVLEERAGSDLNYDPWEQDPVRRREAWGHWSSWLEQGGRVVPPGEAGGLLAPAALQSYLRDIMSGEVDKAERAIGKLGAFPAQGIGGIEAYLKGQSELPVGLRARLKEAQYRLLLGSASLEGGRRIARLLAGGNRDERVEGLDLLGSAGAPVTMLPLVGEALRDPDPLVRERAMDLLLAMGKERAIPLAEEHLRRDRDPNVTHAAIRALGKIGSAASARMLAPYLKGEDEDQVAATLQSLSLLGEHGRAVRERVMPCFGHGAWRVRAAAVNWALKTRESGLEEVLRARLTDEDSFVRSVAVQALVVSSREGLSGKNTRALIEAAGKHPDLQGPIYRALHDGSKPVPSGLLDLFDKLEPEVKLVALSALKPTSPRERGILEMAAAGQDLDLACAALGVLAKEPGASPKVRELVAGALSGTSEEKRAAVLPNLRWSAAKVTSSVRWREVQAAMDQGEPVVVAPTTGEGTAAVSGPLDELFSAFGESAAVAAPAPGPPAPAPVASAEGGKALDDLFDAFAEKPAGPVSGPEKTAASAAEKSDDIVEAALQGIANVPDLAGADEASVRAREAALLLLSGGSGVVADRWQAVLPKLDVQDRADLAGAISDQPHPSHLPLVRDLLRDRAAEIRQRAFREAVRSDDFPVLVRLALREMARPGALLQPQDVYESLLRRFAWRSSPDSQLQAEAERLVAEDRDTPSQVLGLVLLRVGGKKETVPLVLARLDSKDEWVRRAAVLALAKAQPKEMEERLDALHRDPSVWVREAVAAAFCEQFLSWTERFSDTVEVESDPSYFSSVSHSRSRLFDSSRGGRTLAPGTLQALRRLTTDGGERVRLKAWMALLVKRQEIDVAALTSLLDASPEREAWSEVLATFFKERHGELGPALKPLLGLVDRDSIPDEAMAEIESRFGMTGGGPPQTDFSAYEKASGEAALALPAGDKSAPQLVEKKSGSADEGSDLSRDDPVQVVFFHNPGCPECEQVRKDLETLGEEYPGLRVAEHNIRDTPAVLLNEALCTRFDVESGLRLVTPAVFLQEGALIKTGITPVKLRDLIEETLLVGDSGAWHQIAQEELATARETVEERFETLEMAGVVLAGFLDGLNPCAFATIIFFLSYLQVTKRSSRDILAIGGAFILAVFLTYFVLGLGLVEVVGRLQAFRTAGLVLNWLLALACLWIAWLSFRDAKRAREGRLKEMTLQLPAFLKERIRGVIRSGARSHRFILAAFASGVVISVLELACTGQVYLPTIVYAMKSGATSAWGFLLLYNVAFILPLIAVFVLAWRGMTSDALIRFQQNHTAGVKTALGCLFLLLFLMLVWSGRL